MISRLFIMLTSYLFRKAPIVATVLVLLLALLPGTSMAMGIDRNAEITKFAKEMELSHGLSYRGVLAILRNTKLETQALRILSRPPEQKVTWLDYKKRFINPTHISNGKQFIQDNQAVLQRAYQEYGVPPSIIVAIIGVETNYGQLYGTYRTIDILTTIAFSEYRRAEFFRGELEEFLLLANTQSKDPFSYVSSYAGAMGYGQFLPSSYRRYGIDFDGDGKVDLTNSIEDAIGSIANYLSAFGWNKDEQVVLAAKLTDTTELDKIKFNSSLEPDTTIRKLMSRYDLIPVLSREEGDWRPTDKVTALKFAGEQPELWLGLHNYYVLSRYNPSHKYVMALFLLNRSLINQI